MNHQAEHLERLLQEERAKVAALEADKARGFVPEGYVVAPVESRALLTNILAELERGFVVCETCGDQEDTKDLDCVADLEFLQRMLAAPAPAERAEPKLGVLAGEPEEIGKRCADGGTCHHSCKTECFRRTCCVPFLASGLNDDWTVPNTSPAPAAPDVAGLVEVSSKILAKLQHPTYSVNILDTEALEKALATFHREG